eukprot:gene8756-10376_t
MPPPGPPQFELPEAHAVGFVLPVAPWHDRYAVNFDRTFQRYLASQADIVYVHTTEEDYLSSLLPVDAHRLVVERTIAPKLVTGWDKNFHALPHWPAYKKLFGMHEMCRNHEYVIAMDVDAVIGARPENLLARLRALDASRTIWFAPGNGDGNINMDGVEVGKQQHLSPQQLVRWDNFTRQQYSWWNTIPYFRCAWLSDFEQHIEWTPEQMVRTNFEQLLYHEYLVHAQNFQARFVPVWVEDLCPCDTPEMRESCIETIALEQPMMAPICTFEFVGELARQSSSTVEPPFIFIHINRHHGAGVEPFWMQFYNGTFPPPPPAPSPPPHIPVPAGHPIAFLIPVHPPKMPDAVKFHRTARRYLEDEFDVVYLHTWAADHAQSKLPPAAKTLVVEQFVSPTAIGRWRGLVGGLWAAHKKLLGINELCVNHEYVIALDCDSVIASRPGDLLGDLRALDADRTVWYAPSDVGAADKHEMSRMSYFTREQWEHFADVTRGEFSWWTSLPYYNCAWFTNFTAEIDWIPEIMVNTAFEQIVYHEYLMRYRGFSPKFVPVHVEDLCKCDQPHEVDDCVETLAASAPMMVPICTFEVLGALIERTSPKISPPFIFCHVDRLDRRGTAPFWAHFYNNGSVLAPVAPSPPHFETLAPPAMAAPEQVSDEESAGLDSDDYADNANGPADDPVLWWKFDDDSSTDTVQGVPLTLYNGAFVAKGALHFPTSTTNRPYAIASNLTVAVTWESGEHTLATWISLASLEVPGGACPMAVQNSVSGHFDGFVWQERVHHQWMAGSENYRRSGPADNGGNAESVVGYPVHMVITYGARGVCIYRNGVAYCPCYDVPFFWQDATSMGSEVLFGTRGIHNGQTFGTFTGSVEEAAVYDYELSPRQVGELYSAGLGESSDHLFTTSAHMPCWEAHHCS